MGLVRVNSDSVPLRLVLANLGPEVRPPAAGILVGMRTLDVVDRLLQPDIHLPSGCLANHPDFNGGSKRKLQQALIRIDPENIA